MDTVFFLISDWAHLVYRFTDDVNNTTEGLATDRCADLLACVDDNLTALEAVGGVHSNCTNRVFTQMLGYFEHQVVLTVVNGRIGYPKCVIDLRQFAGLELDVNNCADDLRYFSSVLTHGT